MGPWQLERVFLFAICWGVAGLLDSEDRVKLDAWLRGVDGDRPLHRSQFPDLSFTPFFEPPGS